METNITVVNISELLPGDVLFHHANKSKPHRELISMAIQSDYTHASIYLGNGDIADANFTGIRKVPLVSELEKCSYVAVLRSQLGFVGSRPATLRAFIDDLIERNYEYDFRGLVKYALGGDGNIAKLAMFIDEVWEKLSSWVADNKNAYFCSALIVACFHRVGIIDVSAEYLFRPNDFSPKDLYEEPTFGWYFGHLVPPGGQVPEDDPFAIVATSWQPNMANKWW